MGEYPVQRLLSGSSQTEKETPHACEQEMQILVYSHKNQNVDNTQAANKYLPAYARCGGSYGCWPV